MHAVKVLARVCVFTSSSEYCRAACRRGRYFYKHALVHKTTFKVVRDSCQKITLLLLKCKSVRVIVPESVFKREYLFSKTVDIILP